MNFWWRITDRNTNEAPCRKGKEQRETGAKTTRMTEYKIIWKCFYIRWGTAMTLNGEPSSCFSGTAVFQRRWWTWHRLQTPQLLKESDKRCRMHCSTSIGQFLAPTGVVHSMPTAQKHDKLKPFTIQAQTTLILCLLCEHSSSPHNAALRHRTSPSLHHWLSPKQAPR